MATSDTRCAIYARVSTAGQQSVPAQIDAMRDYATRRGWTVVMEVSEVGSGAKARPKREAVMVEARRRDIDVIVVAKLDRWGRSLSDLVNSLEELAAIGVGFVSLADSLDMTTPGGRAFAGMLKVFAAFERDLIVDRVRNGLIHAKKHGTRSGKAIGRPATARERSVEVRALRSQGLSLPAIVAKTGLSYGSVHRIAGGAAR